MATTPSDKKDLFHALAAKFPEAVHTLGADTKQWAKQAGLAWEIKDSPCAFTTDGKKINLFEGKRILWRSDTQAPLSVVGRKFQEVQPQTYLDFYGEMAERYGFKVAVAGSYLGGRVVWACAETPHALQAMRGDNVSGALFMAGACDGTMSTRAVFSSFRLRCLNQLPVFFTKRGGVGPRGVMKRTSSVVFSLSHAGKFNPSRVAQNLELMNETWKAFGEQVKALQAREVSEQQAIGYFKDLFYKGEEQVLTREAIEAMNERHALVNVLRVYEEGEGQKAITGSAWGLVNAVTRYVDHEVGAASEQIQFRKAWVDSAGLKQRAFEAAVDLLG